MLVSAAGIAAVLAATGLLAPHARPAGGRRRRLRRGSASAREPCPEGSGVPAVLLVPTLAKAHPSSGDRPASAAAPRLPSPPSSYGYESFMEWFDAQSWASMGLPMTPTRSWFDVDAAITTGPRRAWFAGKDMTGVAALAKRLNRFLFMKQIMLSGSDDMQSSMSMHLLILWLLWGNLNASSHSTLALDAGCGNGWLAAAFALLRGDAGGRVLGFDLDGVDEARRNIAMATPEVTKGKPQSPLPELFSGNLLAEDFGVNGTADLPPYSFDAVNVGAALRSDDETSPAFLRLTRLLRKGGALIVPICKEPPASDGRCKADLRLYRRNEQGQVVREVHGRYDVAFVAVETAPAGEAKA